MSDISNSDPAPQSAPPPGSKAWIWLVGVVLVGGVSYQALKSNRLESRVVSAAALTPDSACTGK